MTSAVELQVPIQVDMEIGNCWGGTQPIDFAVNPD